MRYRDLRVCFILFVLVFSNRLFSQQMAPIEDQSLLTTEEALVRLHVEHTEQGLLKALQSADPSTRELAARVLSSDGDKQAVPALETALQSEHVPAVRASIAAALAKMQDPMGRRTMASICNDSSVPNWERMQVAVEASHLADNSCLPAVIEILMKDNHDRTARKQAVDLVPSFRNLPPQDFKVLFRLVLDKLADPDHGVRMAASAVLGQIGDPSAIPSLRSALVREKSEGARLVMEQALDGLSKQESK